MIRALHHMADAPKALGQIRSVLQPNAIFILEFANKLNLKAVLRYIFGRQSWNPFTLEPVEFVKLNFDFHPKAIRSWLQELGFTIEKTLTVSHFRLGLLKRIIPARLLAALDGLFQPTGAFFQFTPSVFVKARVKNEAGVRNFEVPLKLSDLFKCPECGSGNLQEKTDHLHCSTCTANWGMHDGIYDFRARK